MEIMILGTGCSKCEKLEKNLEVALKELSIDANIEKVDNLAVIVSYGVMSTPGLVIDGEVKSIGKVPNVKELKKMLGK
ncbi:small redox-active disulfide protein 2 [Keratinibaculum paraultunense]|uniref:Small redox-active disulfide protein 2 n=1 Tax=Keratinibaculum paraultunense TaxID=1278232 RepID=A0A4R3KV24_9FIRM|nr:thioredoxin family protein [Keratinibaculum paraultunense]QQY79859.1 TM0996/MTH895 family glutaredoxin-like protein [Keratinibaculum paraultunense]TCS88744.1 small redox-active disulfide protein 2 [Keratinibaculum paraultunense]